MSVLTRFPTFGSFLPSGAANDLSSIGSGGAPSFLREPPGLVVFSNATGSLVTCTASGDPRPAVSWTNETGSSLEPLPGLRRVRPDGTLEFLPFRGEDYRQDAHSAVYRCKAANVLGSVFSRNVHVRAGE